MLPIERMRLLPDHESRRTFHERVLLEQLQALQRRLQLVHAHETQHGSASGLRVAAICNGLHFILTALRHYNNDFVSFLFHSCVLIFSFSAFAYQQG